MVQSKVILDRRKPKSDGTYPIYFRITEYKKVFYLHSGFSIKLQFWNEEEKRVTKDCPNGNLINASISTKFLEIQKAHIELEDSGLFSIDALKLKLQTKNHQVQTFKAFADKIIEDMFKENRTGNALVYQQGVNSVFRYKPSIQLRFTDISIEFLHGYIQSLTERGFKINTIGNYLRSIRAIYNKAIKVKLVDRRYYPFTEITIKREKTAKRAFATHVLKDIRDKELTNNAMIKARDYYLLSFYLIGMNFTDILRQENIVEGRVEYKRSKTGTFYSIKLFPDAEAIFEKYSDKTTKYLLPIFSDTVASNGKLAKKVACQWIKTTNKLFKSITLDMGLTKPCTTYTARHSWATIAKRLGYSKELISEALGYVRMGTYLSKTLEFDGSQIGLLYGVFGVFSSKAIK